MIPSLIGKELRQHWWAFLLIGGLNLLSLLLVLLLVLSQTYAGSTLSALNTHSYFFLPVFALILGNRLVVAEYGSRTQLFLESLPLPRLPIVVVKFLLGLLVILLCAGTVLAITLAASARTEEYTPRFLGILAARYISYAAFVYAFFFGMGFLGRYRFAAYALFTGGVYLLVRFREIQFFELGPIHLVGDTFPFEREEFPVISLAVTGGLTLAFALMGICLALVREGSVSSLLGERMSYRDKISLAALAIGILVGIGVMEDTKAKEPYRMEGGSASTVKGSVSVTVSPASGEAEALADRLARDLGEMAEYLRLEKLPPVFVVGRADLDPDRLELGHLADAEGIIRRTNWQHGDWDYARCVEHLCGDLVRIATDGRIDKEDRFWMLDGFTLYWPYRGDPDHDLDRHPHLLLRVLHGRERLGGLREPADLERWSAHQQVIHHEITAGIGWAMLRVLEREAGPEQTRDLLAEYLGDGAPPKALATLRDLSEPVPQRFRRITGLDLGEFLDRWNAALDPWEEKMSDQLAAIPRLEGQLEFTSEDGATVRGRYRFTPPVETGEENFRRPVLLYGETRPFHTWLPEHLETRLRLDADGPGEGWLRDTWGSGAEVAWTFAADSPALRCRIISGWRHQKLP